MFSLFADEAVQLPHNLLTSVAGSLIFGCLGIGLLVLGYFVFDILVKKVDFSEELKKGNVSVAVVVAAFLLGLSYIVAHVVL